MQAFWPYLTQKLLSQLHFFFLHYHCINMICLFPIKIAHIVTFAKDGLLHADITKKLGVHHTIVGCIINQFNESEDFYYVRPKIGHLCILEEHEIWVAAWILAKSDAANITELQKKYFQHGGSTDS